MFWTIARFEMNFHRRQYLFYVLSGVFFLLSFLGTTTEGVQIGGNFSNVNINSPFAILIQLSTLSVITLLGAIAFSASGVIRDQELKMAELFLSTPVRKFEYVYGRFFGSFVFAAGIYLAAALGILIGEFMPWLDQERIGAFNLSAYLYSIWLVGLPNLFICSSILFCIATATRSMMATYTGMVALLMLTFLLETFNEPATVETISILDPFATTAIFEVTRYWTVFEKNTLLPAVEGAFLLNRLLWMAIALAFLALASWLYPFNINPSRKQRKKAALLESDSSPSAPVSAALPQVHQRFDVSTLWQQFWSQTRLEVKSIVRSTAFLILLLMGLLLVIANAAGNLGNMFGTSVYPTTAIMLDIINGAFSLPLLFVLVYYAGELMVRERQVRISGIIDAMPFQNWVMLAAKLSALTLVIVAMLLSAMLAGIGVQLSRGYYEIELLHYLAGLLFFFQFPIYLMMVLAIFAYILTRNKFFAMALMVVYVMFLLAAPQIGLEHALYRMRMPFPAYSAFTGYGHNLVPILWQSLYWGLFGCLLLLMVQLLWPRGIEDDWRNRLKVARQRLTRPMVTSFAVVSALFVITGGWIYYNTNVLNDYSTFRDRERMQAEYEKRYQQNADLTQPAITSVYAEVDIYPDTRDVMIKGRYSLTNRSSEAISEIHISLMPELDLQMLDIAGATQTYVEESLGYRIYELRTPLAPGADLTMDFDVAWTTPGFANNGHGSERTSNGTFFNNAAAFPQIGYQRSQELQDNNTRRRFDLPPVQRAASIDDAEALMKSPFGGSGRVDFETIVSTAVGQTALAPGYLIRDWQEDGRHYFHYRMDAPIWNFYSFMSAAYEVKKDTWTSPAGDEVVIEVYYVHDYNIDTMIRSTKNSLDYFTENFSPYQYRQFRILEFPRFQGAFAQAFPNTIPFSEAIGFIADLRDPREIDYVFYVTAHELAHQWWGHQVIGADVQGSTMIVESLAQYSALMAMEREYGPDHMQRFLAFELDRYLQGRGGEAIEEMPLYLVENQAYIHYRKGSLVLYAIKDYIGEDNMNRALADFLDKFAFGEPPYPTTRDLISSIRAHTPAEFQHVITDMLERIVLFDLRVTDSQLTTLADGRYEVTLEISADKFEASGGGVESSVNIADWVDVGVFGAEDPFTGVPTTLYLQKHLIDRNQQQIVVTVDSEPVTVGIDPLNKLIDRNPSDNVIPAQ
jgi:ABC-2 type transport system permease protein